MVTPVPNLRFTYDYARIVDRRGRAARIALGSADIGGLAIFPDGGMIWPARLAARLAKANHFPGMIDVECNAEIVGCTAKRPEVKDIAVKPLCGV